MVNLDDSALIKELDPSDTLTSTEHLLKQCQTAWNEINSLTFNEKFDNVQNIVCCGMGASIYGALVMKALEGSDLKYPLELVTDYNLPKYVNSNTLVILTSYSGTTEEVLSCANQAKEKQAKMVVLTKGAKLGEFATLNNIPAYIFTGDLNPAGVPRLGNGYTVIGLLGLLNKIGIININVELLTKAFKKTEEGQDNLKKLAKESVENFLNKTPIIIAAEHLSGNAQILRNQFNETSKTFSSFYLVPDLNHHLMEGLQFPIENNYYFVLLNSDNYSTKIKKRMALTKEVIEKNNKQTFEFNAKGENIYEDFLNTMVFGSFLTLYLGLLYKQNPATNPWVDYFKDQLKK